MPTSSEKLVFQPPHTLNTNEQAFFSQLTPQEKKLHELATKMLGSSYFMGKTHGYTKWTAKQSSQGKQPPATK